MSSTPHPETAVSAIMQEHDYVCSLIRMYRESQMQLIAIAMVLYTAVLGLVGSALDKPRLADVIQYSAALISFPATLLVLAFGVMEVRIRRASLYVAKTIVPMVDALLPAESKSVGGLLRFEYNPGIHLRSWQKLLSSSTVFVLALGVPALAAGVWYLRPALQGVARPLTPIAVTGCLLLLGSMAVAALGSTSHEWRRIRRRVKGPAKPSP